MTGFCGCCGQEIPDESPALWCDQCSPHIGTSGFLWDRTYFAQHDADCPFQVGTQDATDPDPCPECAAGKCQCCDGRTWDALADCHTPCPCAEAGHK